MSGQNVQIRIAGPEEVVDLRHAILRAGLPRESAIFPGDDHPDARHVVACDSSDRIVGCATAHLNEWNGVPAWQIRGMATDPACRGAGVGKALLDFLESELTERPDVRLLWCNARVPAIGFYQRLGWTVVSDPFDVPTAGPHVKMTKNL